MRRVPSNVQHLFAKWGKRGGATRARRLSPTQRRAIAVHAARSRWHTTGTPPLPFRSTRLTENDWTNPVFLEEVLTDGSIADWQELYHRLADRPFDVTARALETVLHATDIYGVTPLWKGILRQLQGAPS